MSKFHRRNHTEVLRKETLERSPIKCHRNLVKVNSVEGKFNKKLHSSTFKTDENKKTVNEPEKNENFNLIVPVKTNKYEELNELNTDTQENVIPKNESPEKTEKKFDMFGMISEYVRRKADNPNAIPIIELPIIEKYRKYTETPKKTTQGSLKNIDSSNNKNLDDPVANELISPSQKYTPKKLNTPKISNLSTAFNKSKQTFMNSPITKKPNIIINNNIKSPISNSKHLSIISMFMERNCNKTTSERKDNESPNLSKLIPDKIFKMNSLSQNELKVNASELNKFIEKKALSKVMSNNKTYIKFKPNNILNRIPKGNGKFEYFRKDNDKLAGLNGVVGGKKLNTYRSLSIY